jgi:hypothetical protein
LVFAVVSAHTTDPGQAVPKAAPNKTMTVPSVAISLVTLLALDGILQVAMEFEESTNAKVSR